MNDIYVDSEINSFLNENYRDGYAFFAASVEFARKKSLDMPGGYDISNVVIYADNDTIVNGGHYYRLSEAENTEWYRKYLDSEKGLTFVSYYVGKSDMSALSMRRLSLVRRLDYFKKDSCEKILRVDLDYNRILRELTQISFGNQIYVCQGDRILFSNGKHSGSQEDFHTLTGEEQIAFKKIGRAHV